MGYGTRYAIPGRNTPAARIGFSGPYATSTTNTGYWEAVLDTSLLFPGKHYALCVDFDGHGERDSAHSYYSSKQMQKTCKFWLLTVWLLAVPSTLYIL